MPRTKYESLLADNRIWFGKNGTNVPRIKTFISELEGGIVPMTIWKFKDVGHNQEAKQEVKALFDGNGYFDSPKPVRLIENILRTATDPNAIVLDFFSGSGTTAHAVMQLNAEDGGNRTHIQVQLPEPTDEKSDAFKAGYKTIADIAKERIRRAGKKIRDDYADKISERSTPLDTGFRVYKLSESNFRVWNENEAKSDIGQAVLDFAANKKPEASPEALLAEIMLQTRMPLSASIEKRELQNGGWVYVVDGGNLIAYVDTAQITEAQGHEIADLAPGKLVVLDSAFDGNDALKINIANICKEKFIKEFKTI
jgi:adenine-specific DNA-methyltransferase